MIPTYQYKTNKQEDLKKMFESAKTSTDEISVEYKDDKGESKTSLIVMSEGLKKSLAFWEKVDLPPFPTLFVAGVETVICDSPTDSETQLPPSELLNDSVSKTCNVSNGLGSLGDVSRQLLQ